MKHIGLRLIALVAAPACALSLLVSQAMAFQETDGDILAVQVRVNGFVCDKPLAARRDAKHSKPDHAVWVLKCSNATYRVSRVPDMAAKVEPLH